MFKNDFHGGFEVKITDGAVQFINYYEKKKV